MNDIDLTDPKLKTAAFILAEKTPRHLNVPTTPPIHWRLEGEILRVLLADGRTVRAPLADQVYSTPVTAAKASSDSPVKSKGIVSTPDETHPPAPVTRFARQIVPVRKTPPEPGQIK